MSSAAPWLTAGPGQRRLKGAKILIVGAGGLGCPAAAYLAGAGVGTLGFVDGDVVEPSNLHRQIAHSTARVGMLKVDSLAAYCKEYVLSLLLSIYLSAVYRERHRGLPTHRLNPLPEYIPHREHLTPVNAEDIVKGYDLVLDCTDHPTSRYLISDICVLLEKPLVSASALRTDGQLIVLNTPSAPQGLVTPKSPPCYRCVFPRPPPPSAVVSCGEGGILGPVVGVMGVLQALEAVKVVAAGLHAPGLNRPAEIPATAAAEAGGPPALLLFSAGGAPGAQTFRSVRMRTRRRECFACGEGSRARLTLETLRSGSLDYLAFCGGVGAPVRVLGDEQRVTAAEYERVLREPDAAPHLLIDVREKGLFDIASIEGAINIPYSEIQRSARRKKTTEDDGAEVGVWQEWIPTGLSTGTQPVYVVCRVGNDSQLVAKQLIDLGLGRNSRWIGDIKGGMRAWRDQVDKTLPFL